PALSLARAGGPEAAAHERGGRAARARTRARPLGARGRLPRGSRPLRARAVPRSRPGQAGARALGPLGRARGDGRAARAVRRVARARECVSPRRIRARFRTLAACHSRLSSTSPTIRPRKSRFCSRARRPGAARSCSPAARLPARPTSARRRNSPTGARSSCGGATSAACRPTTSARTTASRATLLDRLQEEPHTIHRIRGEASPAEAAAELDSALAGAQLDFLLLGMGPDGHMASLFPGSPQLEVTDRRATHGPPGLEPWVDRITFTVPTIQSAKRIVFLIAGESKAEAAARAFTGEISPDTPSSLARLAPVAVEVFLDPAAAARIRT